MEEKPKAIVEYVGYEVQVGHRVCNIKTKEEAERYAKEWEAEEVKKWEERNSQEKRNAERNKQIYYRINNLIGDLKVEAQQAGKMGNATKVEFLRGIRVRLERLMEECEKR